MKGRIGLLGGTFDPIHFGHLEIAKTALNQLNLTKLLILPAGNPWQKDKITDINLRLEMVKIATKNLKNVEVSEIEIDNDGPTYTYETLQDLHQIYKDTEFILLLGSDAAANFDTWKEPNLVKALARIYVVQRAGDFAQDWRFDRLHMPEIKISSREIRECVKNRNSINEFVPKEVADFILANDLYRS
jgi:nicotinate-nucleotide adenylyltransferase